MHEFELDMSRRLTELETAIDRKTAAVREAYEAIVDTLLADEDTAPLHAERRRLSAELENLHTEANAIRARLFEARTAKVGA